MKKDTHIDPVESKKQCYIMIGHQVKYEPAFVERKHKKVLDRQQVGNGRKSITQALVNSRVKSA
jgi:hypothetical protein